MMSRAINATVPSTKYNMILSGMLGLSAGRVSLAVVVGPEVEVAVDESVWIEPTVKEPFKPLISKEYLPSA